MTDNLLKLREFLGREEQASILIKKNPDLDQMAAALSLYLGLLKAGKKTFIISPSEPIVEHSSLVGLDKVSTQIKSSGRDLTMVLPYEKGRIEKISYDIENDKIHLVVKAGPDGLGFDQSQINFLSTGGSSRGIFFLVGVKNLQEDLAPLYSPDLFKGQPVVEIGREGSQNLSSDNLQLIDSGASSISELMASLLVNLGAPLDVDIAQNLLNGINFATNNFQNEETSALAFEMAALLLRYGAKRKKALEEKPKVQEWAAAPDKKKDQEEAPLDWLTPKIYKGGNLI